jgi:hypothetical protein
MISVLQDTGSGALWLSVIRRLIVKRSEELSLLDLCCCECTGTQQLKWKKHVAVDVVDWKKPDHIDFHLGDAITFAESAPKNGFDVCICSDGIEHFSKDNGWRLLRAMEHSAKLSIIFTPLGDLWVDQNATHPDHHKSGWLPEELSTVGWNVESYPKWHSDWNAGAFFAWR